MQHSTTTARDLVLDVRDLVKRYPGRSIDAVSGVSLQLHRGEVLGLLGPNGAGKTTTVEILTGFRTRTGGSIRLLGLDPGVRADLRELRRRVGVVLQQTGHYRFLSVRETLEMHHAFHDDPRGVDEVLELVGLTAARTQRVRTLSGGQQRRLDVGVALIGRPEVIFLDEPTTGFDPAARRRTWDVVQELTSLGTSVVLTSHYMEEVSFLADRVVVLGQGSVVGEGTPAELAHELRLGTVIRASLPYGITHADLPADIRAGLVEPGRFQMRVDAPADALAQLCQWALDRGMRLEDLDVRAPSLEDSYLALTEGGEQGVAAAAPDDVRAAVEAER
ncbi:MAG: ABC transporter ATP-binding protein [Candidatus Cloacimonetes bacterium]|nr:ABC transporter ATP-binding protein [Candidatus Cloacimonadota bacterium]